MSLQLQNLWIAISPRVSIFVYSIQLSNSTHLHSVNIASRRIKHSESQIILLETDTEEIE